MKKIAVLGAGNVGCATAGILVLKGNSVSLYSRSERSIKPILKRGGIDVVPIRGVFTDESALVGFAEPDMVTTKIESAIKDAELIWVTVPAYAHRDIAAACAGHLEDGQVVLLTPGSAGSVEFVNVLKEKREEAEICMAETVTVPIGGIIRGPARVAAAGLRKTAKTRTAAFPAKETSKVIDFLKEFFNAVPSKNVIETGLLNPNHMIYPGPMLLNLGQIEKRHGDLSLLNEGMSDSVLRLIESMDSEKLEVCKVVGASPVSIDDIYSELGSPPAFRLDHNPLGFRNYIHDRYITESCPYGLVFIASLGDLAGVSTPLMDAVIRLLSTVTMEDFWEQGRTIERLGLSGMTVEQLNSLLYEGKVN